MFILAAAALLLDCFVYSIHVQMMPNLNIATVDMLLRFIYLQPGYDVKCIPSISSSYLIFSIKYEYKCIFC